MPPNNESEIRRRLNMLAETGPEAQAAQQALDRVRRFLSTEQPQTKPSSTVLWRQIMKKVTPFAVAAGILAAAFVLFNPFRGSTLRAEDIIKQLEQIQTVTYKARMAFKGVGGLPPDQTLTAISQIQLDYNRGLRMDSQVNKAGKIEKTIGCVQFDKGLITTILPNQKRYLRLTLTEELRRKMETENGDPRTLLGHLMESEYTSLGRKTIDGVEVEGIEVVNPKSAGQWMWAGTVDQTRIRVWVNPDTKLPIRCETHGTAKDGSVSMDIFLENYQWDVPIDPTIFDPQIPSDFILLGEQTLNLDSQGEDTIAALKYLSQALNGRYPSALNALTLGRELATSLRSRYGAVAPQPPAETIARLQSIGMSFAAWQNDGKDPAYYGSRVTTEFPHAVLLRWKISDDSYRVIFADLSVRDVPPDELKRLEAQPLNLKPTAIHPIPADGLEGTSLEGLKLQWMPGNGAVTHRVFFGTDPDSLVLLGETTDLLITVPVLIRNARYAWRVDEIQADGSTVTGTVWTFHTGKLVAWWKLDDIGDTAVDSSGNDHGARIAGDLAWVPGVVGGAALCGENDSWLDAGQHKDFNICAQITVSAWIKVNKFDSDWQAIVAKGDTAWRLQRNWGNNTLEFACNGVYVPVNNIYSLYGVTNVNDGKWHHVAGTYDGADMRLYVDGKLDAAKPASGPILANESPVFIGANAEKPGRCFNGLIDEIRIYNYSLNPDEIAILVNPGSSAANK